MTQGYERTTSLLQEAGEAADRLVPPADLGAVLAEGSRRARRRGRRRRTVGAALLAGAAAAALAVPLPRLLRHGAAPAAARPSLHPAPPSGHPPAVGVERLRGGHWTRMAPWPLAPRGGAVAVWTGRQLIVWGGSNANGDRLYGDGAAYDPTTNRWQVLPAAPVPPRYSATAVWTGQEMVVFGGFVDGSAQVASNQAAAYDPSTGRWELLPPAPVTARAGTVGVVDDGLAFFLGGEEPSGRSEPFDGAALDPTSGTWTHVVGFTPPAGRTEQLVAAVPDGSSLLAFTSWYDQHPSEISGGMDVFAYSPAAGRWTSVRVPRSALPGPAEVLSAGSDVIVRGAPYNCGPCPGPFAPEVTDLYDPAGGSWTTLPPDPLGGNDELSAWTGDALFSYDAGCQCGSHGPGSATLYDPARHTWSELRTAPVGCGDAVFWTGSQILVACVGDGGSGAPGGLLYTPAPAPAAPSSVLRLSLSRTSATAGTPLAAQVPVANRRAGGSSLEGAGRG